MWSELSETIKVPQYLFKVNEKTLTSRIYQTAKFWIKSSHNSIVFTADFANTTVNQDYCTRKLQIHASQ